MGVPMGVPYFQIKDIIKDSNTAVFSSNFTLYRDLSRRIFTLVKKMVPSFEQYSIDEGFFLVEASQAYALASTIRDKVYQEIGMPVSVAVAQSKTLAKLANTWAKKGVGVYVLSEADWQLRSPEVRLGTLWGVGRSRTQQFTEAGLLTAADVMAAPTLRIGALFGIEGVRLQGELRGQSVYAVTTEHAAQKSIMNSRSFKQSTRDEMTVLDAVCYHVRRGVEDLRSQGLCARRMTVSIRSSRFETEASGRGSREVVLEQASDDPLLLVRLATEAAKALFSKDIAYKKAGVVFSYLVPKATVQQALFASAESPERNQVIAATLDTLNGVLGQDMVRMGSYGKEAGWKSRREALSPSYTTRWGEIKVVSAR